MRTNGKFQYVKSATSTRPCFMDRETFVATIRSGVLRDLTRRLREYVESGDEERYQDLKRELPAMMWCGVSRDGRQRKASCLLPTGYFMIDVDGMEGAEAARELCAKIGMDMQDSLDYADRLAVAHVTPSGRGLRLVVQTTGTFSSVEDEMMAFIARFPYMSRYGHVDEVVKDYSRLSFLVPEEDFLVLKTDIFGSPVETAYVNDRLEEDTAAKAANPTVEGTDAGKAAPADPPAYEEIRQTYRYNDVPVADIAKRYVEKKGVPQKGERHEFYNGMVKNFRNICDNNPQVLHAVLPRFGKSFDETLKQCEFMCKSNNTTAKSKDFYLFLVGEGIIKPRKKPVTENEVRAATAPDEPEETRTEVVDNLKQLGVIPPVFRELLAICPNEFVYPTITALLPIMGTLTSYLHAYYLDGVEHTTTFFSVVYAPPGSGKSFIDRLRRPLFRLLKQRDELNNLREQIFLAEDEERAEGEKKAKNPHVSVRLFPAINSQTEFLTKMRDNKGFHMFTCAEEVDTFNKGTRAAGGDKSDLFRIAWDNGDYGQSFKGANSFKGSVRLFYNVLLTGTIGQVRNYYRNVENGMVTRVCFSEIENQSFAEVPVWKQLNKKALETIDKFVTRCDFNTYTNSVEVIDIRDAMEMDEETFKKEVSWRSEFKDYTWIDMSWIYPALNRWLETKRLKAMKDVDYALDTFRRRTAVKGFRLAMICTQCWSECREKQQTIIRDFVLKWMEYDLAQSLQLFGEMFNQKMDESIPGVTVCREVFTQLPDEFTKSDVRARLLQDGKKSRPEVIIHWWKKEGLIEMALTEAGEKHYRKIPLRTQNK